ncbi:hypothetical protein HKCCE2091_14440 [Rhodobacterales bacterium HKCCE2091]|nr:hypothetical protein [Rhodobacterales bacterium HKCCE2091]
MSALGALKAALARVASDGLSAGDSAGFLTPADGVACILDRIDLAVLPRKLRFRFEDGSDLTCLAGGRRLLQLLPPAPEGLSPQTAALFDGRMLGPAEAEPVANALIAVTGQHETFRLRAEPDATDPAMGGIGTEAIAAALGLAPADDDDADEGDAIDAFVAALTPNLRGALWVDDQEIEVLNGSDAEVEALSDWAAVLLERLLAPGFPLAASFETDGILVFIPPAGTEGHALVAGRLGQFLVAKVEGADPAATLALWQDGHG